MNVWVAVILAWLVVPLVLWLASLEVALRVRRRRVRRYGGHIIGPSSRSRLP